MSVRGGVHNSPQFRRLWAANVCQEVSRQVGAVALGVTAVVLLDASTIVVGVVSALSNGAYLVLGVPAGVVADRADRRLLLVFADFIRGLSLGSVPVFFLLGWLSVPHILVVAALVSSASVVADTAQTALLPNIVGRRRIGEATARLQLTDSVVQVAGPGLAGVLLLRLAAPLVFAVSGLASLVASVLMLWSRPSPVVAPMPAGRSGSLLVGFRYCWSHPLLRALVLCGCAANFAGGMITPLVQVYALRDLRIDPSLFGLAGGVGAGAGVAASVVVMRVVKRMGELGTFRAVTFGFPVAVCVFPLLVRVGAPPAVALFVGGALLSAVLVLGAVPAAGMRAAVTPSEIMGRVVSSMRVVSVGALPIGSLAGGLFGTVLAPEFAIFAAAFVAAVGILPFLGAPLRGQRSVPMSWLVDDDGGPDL